MRVRSLSAPLTAVVGLLMLLTVGQPPASPSVPSAGVPASPAAVDSRPNIVLILADDMRADELRLMPSVRRLLVRNGTTYRGALSPHPVCCPARAELVTGQFGQNNGVQNNKGPWGGYQALSHPGNTVAAWLQDAGYRTSHHGKYLNGYERFAAPREPGWTRWDTQVGGIYSYDRRAVFTDGDRIDGRYTTHVIGGRSDRTMARFARSGAPFFTVVNHVAPHGSRRNGVWRHPVAERRHQDAYAALLPGSYGEPSFQERDVSDLPADLRRPLIPTRDLVRLARARARALLSVDDAVRRTVNRLRELGELDDTYVVFASDNGFQLGEHRQRGKNLPFDETFEIPLVVRGPGIARGAVVDEPITLVDLAATFLEWAGGVPADRTLDGLPLGRIGTDHPRDTILVQIGDSADDDTDGWRYRGVTTGRYLFAVHAGNPRNGVLFDRAVDPHATVNRIADPAYDEVRRELLRRTRELTSCSGEAACNQSFGPMPKPA
ncbi:sulfatase-like hydrolase/transferase [Nocardioides antri]|uniref:Sulfatase-like hydrolase/transferase n=1 Tax=Nocardioides antri TaxID=2607659 RepID=A0A5B1M0P2_9ACTN|nr:sulfatase-like hydrolase/transferase [Nocardioides antri]KAA1426492.1 sulfatase-like hydrolase/transferase [Nocardioides antri]